MIKFETLEFYFNKYCDTIRNVPNANYFFKGIGHKNTGYSESAEHGTVIYQTNDSKQLSVLIVPLVDGKFTNDPQYNWEHGASLTRNLPHDIQRLMKGK